MIRLLHLIKQGDGSMNEITILGIDLAKNTAVLNLQFTNQAIFNPVAHIGS